MPFAGAASLSLSRSRRGATGRPSAEGLDATAGAAQRQSSSFWRGSAARVLRRQQERVTEAPTTRVSMPTTPAQSTPPEANSFTSSVAPAQARADEPRIDHELPQFMMLVGGSETPILMISDDRASALESLSQYAASQSYYPRPRGHENTGLVTARVNAMRPACRSQGPMRAGSGYLTGGNASRNPRRLSSPSTDIAAASPSGMASRLRARVEENAEPSSLASTEDASAGVGGAGGLGGGGSRGRGTGGRSMDTGGELDASAGVDDEPDVAAFLPPRGMLVHLVSACWL